MNREKLDQSRLYRVGRVLSTGGLSLIFESYKGPLHIMAVVDQDAAMDKVILQVETAGMHDIRSLEEARIILGNVASKQIMTSIGQVEGITSVEVQRNVQAVKHK